MTHRIFQFVRKTTLCPGTPSLGFRGVFPGPFEYETVSACLEIRSLDWTWPRVAQMVGQGTTGEGKQNRKEGVGLEPKTLETQWAWRWASYRSSGVSECSPATRPSRSPRRSGTGSSVEKPHIRHHPSQHYLGPVDCFTTMSFVFYV